MINKSEYKTFLKLLCKPRCEQNLRDFGKGFPHKIKKYSTENKVIGIWKML